MKRAGRLWTVLVLAVISGKPASADDAPADAWDRATQAFNAGNYAEALQQFRAAQDAGQDGAAITYNIAVSEYRLQRYHDARDSFSSLANRFPRMRPLAEYNLGLVAMKLGERDKAAEHFRRSYYLGEDEPKLRALSSTMLRRLVGEQVPVTSRWLRLVSARTGFDDNVILRDETGLAGGDSADSPFVEFLATLRGPYDRSDGFTLDAGVFLVRYLDVDEFNQAAGNVGVNRRWELGDWQIDAGAHGALTTLGGDAFDRSLRVSAAATRRLTSASKVTLRLRHDNVAGASDAFDGVDGTRQRVDLRYRWYADNRSLTAGLQLETNDRQDASVSPQRRELQTSYRYAPEAGLGFEVGGEVRSSRYDDLATPRHEDLLRLDASLTWQMASGWQWFAQFSVSDNDSTDPVFSYTRKQLAVGAFRQF